MAELAEGRYIRTQFGRELRIEKKIGEGGQGAVYKVYDNGKAMALKWYNPSAFKSSAERDLFIHNLHSNIISGAVAPEFLWPLDMTEEIDGTFGYLMEKAPDEYVPAKRVILNNPSVVTSYRRLVDACLNIVTAFCKLHDAGYCYQDLSDGNFFIEPKTGKVLVCDNDNAVRGKPSVSIGTPHFMAPEIVTGVSTARQTSDLHSLAVVIFYLLLFQHPLLGVRSRIMDDEHLMMLYGTDPVFIFDPDDRRNRAIESPENTALRIWPVLPPHLREVFMRAFSREALKHPEARPQELVWIRELVRFRSEIVDCRRCGDEVFLDGAHPARCERCSALCEPSLRMEVAGNQIPVANDARVYWCQTRRVSGVAHALDPQVWAISSKRDPRKIILRNVSTKPWRANASGRTATIAPGGVVAAVDGLELVTDDWNLRVCRNVKQ